MVKYQKPEIKVMHNGIKKEPSFLKRQASKIFEFNQIIFDYAGDFLKISSNSVYIGTMSISLWCVLKLLGVSRYLEHVSTEIFK